MELNGRQLKDAPYCLKGTWGADFYGIDAQPGEEIVIKHRYGGFTGTNLDLLLRSHGIKTVILTGAATNVCVESTARETYMHDYYLVFVSDCTATMSTEAHDYTLKMIDQYFGQVASMDEIIAAWGVQVEPAAAARTSR
jgi:ureidoacrylate peracid hydrolase